MNRNNNKSLNLKPSCLIFVYLRYKEERFFDKLHIVIEWNQDMGNSNNGSKCKYYVIKAPCDTLSRHLVWPRECKMFLVRLNNGILFSFYLKKPKYIIVLKN